MKYVGSKARLAPKIIPIMSKRRRGRPWIEPFCGGCNSIQYVNGRRFAYDNNHYLIEMWKALLSGQSIPTITKADYQSIRSKPDNYPPWLVGWVAINCSYSGKWWGGFAGKVKTQSGLRDYQAEAIRNVEKQLPKLQGVKFECFSYNQIDLPRSAIVYCDPPYQSTLGYHDQFDHKQFWQWVRDNHTYCRPIYVSEYQAPDDFRCIWSQERGSSLSANGKAGGRKQSIERLFVLKAKGKGG